MQRSVREQGSDTTRDGASFLVDRRSYLKLAGVAAGSVPVLAGRAGAESTRHGIRFKRTVNMVTDAGCDPTGQTPCDQQIRDAADDYTLLKFPAGEYKLTEKNVIFDMTNLGFVGHGDVRFTVPENFNDKVILVDRGTGLLFEGIDIDLTAAGATPGLHLAVDDDLEVHDVEFIGQGINPDSDPRGEGSGNPTVTDAFYPIVRNPDGTGRVRNLVAKNAGLMGTYNHGNGRVGVWVGMQHEGTIALENCHIEGFPNNATYCSRTPGTVQIEGGTFRNNDISQIRLSSRDSYVTNATIEVDFDNSDSPNPEDTLNARGVRFEAGAYGYGGATARECDIGMLSVPNSSGAVVVGADGADHSVHDSRIQVDTDGVRALYAYAPTGFGNRDPPPKPHTVTMENVAVTGDAAGNEAIQIRDRADSSVENCCIQQTGANRDGVKLVDSAQNSVTNDTINVTGDTVVPVECDPMTSDISESGSCPTPDDGSGGSFPHDLSIVSNGGRFSYVVSVTGGLGKTTARGASIDSNDTVWAGTATGQGGGGGVDSYGFSGELVVLDVTGDASVSLDGERIDPAQYPDSVLTIEGNGSRAEYTVATSGTLKYTGANDATIDPNDDRWGSTATGQVGGGGRDSYKFTGELVVFDVTGDATAYLNGERINPDDYSDSVVTIEGHGSVAEYTLATSGPLKYTGANDATIDPNDDRWGSTATGQVGGGGRDSYKFTGELVVLDLNGNTTAYLDGERIDPDQYSDDVLTIEAGNSRTEYTLATSGTLKYTGANDATIDPNDDRWGSTVTGQVGSGGRDSYKFTGELVVLDLDGNATAYLNGERIDPDQYLDNVLTIEGNGSRAEYSLETSGTLKRTGANGATIDSNDHQRGTTATGQVGGGGRDSYKFSGRLVTLDLDEGATAYLNGERIGERA